MNCTCKVLSTSPVRYDQSECPTHGPNAPRFFIDHGTIHDKATGKHVQTRPDDGYEDGISACCDLLNELSGGLAPLAERIAEVRIDAYAKGFEDGRGLFEATEFAKRTRREERERCLRVIQAARGDGVTDLREVAARIQADDGR